MLGCFLMLTKIFHYRYGKVVYEVAYLHITTTKAPTVIKQFSLDAPVYISGIHDCNNISSEHFMLTHIILSSNTDARPRFTLWMEVLHLYNPHNYCNTFCHGCNSWNSDLDSKRCPRKTIIIATTNAL